MAKVITLSEKLIKKGELVLIPRSEYERLLNTSKEQKELDKGINQSLKEIKQKKIAGPFNNSKELIKSLSS